MPRLAGRVLLSNLKSVGSSWKGNVSGSCKTKRFPIRILTFGKLLKCSFPFLYFFFSPECLVALALWAETHACL